jgi:PAS domain S-box-containing protein
MSEISHPEQDISFCSEELFSKAFHASPAMMTISHLSDDFSTGYFMDVNEAFLQAVGYTRNEVIGKSAVELCLFADEGQRDKLVSLLRAKGYASEVEMPFRTRNGEIRYALGSIEHIDISGESFVLIVCQDITDRKKANEELQRRRERLEELVEQRTRELSSTVNKLETEIAERKHIEKSLIDAIAYAQSASKAKSEFLANMSHELRTPLNSIIGFAELLMLEASDEEGDDSREKISHILDSAWLLLGLINDILDLSKIEAGKVILECELVSLQSLLDSSLVMLREKAHKRQVELTCDNTVTEDMIYVDPRKVKQILFNLLENAIKFTPANGRVRLHAAPLDIDVYQQYCVLPDLPDARYNRFIQIDVVDTGIGIGPEDMEKLFQPFQQVDSALNRKYDGSGLGLHLSQQFARLHNGCIVAESKVGGGSTFSLLLPCGAPV